jgi:hypothetical protein
MQRKRLTSGKKWLKWNEKNPPCEGFSDECPEKGEFASS